MIKGLDLDQEHSCYKGGKNMDDNKTTLGIPENIEAVLCYLFGWLSGVIFLVLEKQNNFVRFHAMQSITTFLGLFILSMVVQFIPLIGSMLAILIAPVSIILWLLLTYKAYLGEKYKLPILGDWAEKQLM